MWVYVWVEVAVTEPMTWVWVGHWVPIGVTRTRTQVVPEVATRSGNHYPCSPLTVACMRLESRHGCVSLLLLFLFSLSPKCIKETKAVFFVLDAHTHIAMEKYILLYPLSALISHRASSTAHASVFWSRAIYIQGTHLMVPLIGWGVREVVVEIGWYVGGCVGSR
jgi:hypothetical protein